MSPPARPHSVQNPLFLTVFAIIYKIYMYLLRSMVLALDSVVDSVVAAELSSTYNMPVIYFPARFIASEAGTIHDEGSVGQDNINIALGNHGHSTAGNRCAHKNNTILRS